jgi:hypothetical protein
MLPMARSFRVWAYAAPCDLRQSVDDLAELARKHMHATDIGACFLFVNGLRNRARVLHYDGSGWGLYCKRLDEGRHFKALWEDDADPAKPGDPLTLSWAELLAFVRVTPARVHATRAANSGERGAAGSTPRRSLAVARRTRDKVRRSA